MAKGKKQGEGCREAGGRTVCVRVSVRDGECAMGTGKSERDGRREGRREGRRDGGRERGRGGEAGVKQTDLQMRRRLCLSKRAGGELS